MTAARKGSSTANFASFSLSMLTHDRRLSSTDIPQRVQHDHGTSALGVTPTGAVRIVTQLPSRGY